MSGRLTTRSYNYSMRIVPPTIKIFHVNLSRRYLLISPCRDAARHLYRAPAILADYARGPRYLRVRSGPSARGTGRD